MGNCSSTDKGKSNESEAPPQSGESGVGRSNMQPATKTATPVAAATESGGERRVKGLLLLDTLGKGTFGYVKLGVKEETGQQFALKFLIKANRRFKEDTVRAEINCMKRIKHKNVVKLLAYDWSCKYPNQDGGVDDTVLMVLEYAPGGDLYDILFYSGKLDEKLTRTYYVQLCEGLKAIHEAGVTHRDLKANNILLDHKFQLKITDFGLSHIYEGEDIADNRMKTCWVGTKGYQAPELILNRPYSYKADIFSTGVVVFTLLCGHQPFKTAAATDPWYKCIAAKKYYKFWKAHKNDKLTKPCQDIIEKMLSYQPKERWEIDQLLEHDWAMDVKYDVDELYNVMTELHRTAVEKKMSDPKRQERIENSQVKQTSRGAEFVAKYADLPVPTHLGPLPIMNCYAVSPGVNPIEIPDIAIDTAAELSGTHIWDPDNFAVTVQVTAATEDSDSMVESTIRVVERNNAHVVIMTRSKSSGLDLQAEMEVLDEIWCRVSAKLAGPYYEEYDHSAYDYSNIDFDTLLVDPVGA